MLTTGVFGARKNAQVSIRGKLLILKSNHYEISFNKRLEQRFYFVDFLGLVLREGMEKTCTIGVCISEHQHQAMTKALAKKNRYLPLASPQPQKMSLCLIQPTRPLFTALSWGRHLLPVDLLQIICIQLRQSGGVQRWTVPTEVW